MNKRNLLIACGLALAAAVLVFSNIVFKSSKENAEVIASPSGMAEGVHFRAVKNSAEKLDKIQVQEFFWYGCHHCQAFEPKIREYKKTLPSDAEVAQIPVTWNEATKLHAAIFYLAQSNNAPDALHDELFTKIMALRGEGNLQAHVQQAEDVFKSHGIELNDFKAQLASTEIQAKVNQSSELMEAFEITGTPSMVVDGSWAVLNTKEVAEVGIFKVIDHLISKARAAR